MSNQNIQQIAATIQRYNNLAIVVGGEPSVDSLGGALAFSLALNSIGKKVEVITKNPARAEHSRLVGVNKISQKISGTSNYIIALPNAVDLIEKVSCYADGQNLNIVLQPYPDVMNFDPNSMQVSQGGGQPEVFIAIDVPSLPEVLTPLTDNQQIPTVALGKIGDQNATFACIDRQQASTSQIIMLAIQELKIPVTADIANNILQGLYAATNDFHAPNITPRVFEDAAQLLKVIHGEVGRVHSPVSSAPTQQPQAQVQNRPQNPAPRPQAMPNSLPQVPRPQAMMPKGGGMNAEAPSWDINPNFEFEKAPDQKMYSDMTMGGPAPMAPTRQQPQGQMQNRPMQGANQPMRERQQPRRDDRPVEPTEAELLQRINQAKQSNQNQQQNRQSNQGQRDRERDQRSQPQNQPSQSEQMMSTAQQPVQEQNRRSQPMNNDQGQNGQNANENPEDDWLAPKIYKTEDLL